jgi:hypothetical protein
VGLRAIRPVSRSSYDDRTSKTVDPWLSDPVRQWTIGERDEEDLRETWDNLGVDVVDRVRAVLLLDPNVTGVELVGSRSIGTETALSDWDIQIAAVDFDELMAALPALTEKLRPLAAQWVRLSSRPVYMLILPGGIKVDLFADDRPRTSEPPWQAQSDNLNAIDAHFWDWILWLAGKQLRGQAELVHDECEKLYVHLLQPLGATAIPRTITFAVEEYLDLRVSAEYVAQVPVDPRLGEAVFSRLRDEGLV